MTEKDTLVVAKTRKERANAETSTLRAELMRSCVRKGKEKLNILKIF